MAKAASLVVAAVGALVGIGIAGHLLLERLGFSNDSVVHEVFHLAYPGLAALVFFVVVALDIRRNGRPRFSWRPDD